MTNLTRRQTRPIHISAAIRPWRQRILLAVLIRQIQEVTHAAPLIPLWNRADVWLAAPAAAPGPAQDARRLEPRLLVGVGARAPHAAQVGND